MRRIIQGDKRRIRYTLTDVDTGNLVNASAFQVVAAEHGGTSATYTTSDPEVSNSGTGLYDFYTHTLAVGTYWIEFQSDGTYPDRKRVLIQIVPKQT